MERLLERKQQLEAELKCIQDSINRAEEAYFQETIHHGNIIKGFEGYLKMEKLGSSSGSSSGSGTSGSSSSSSQKFKSSSSSSVSQFLKNNKNRVFSESSFAFPRPYPLASGSANSYHATKSAQIGRVEFVDDDSLVLDPIHVRSDHTTKIIHRSEFEDGISSTNSLSQKIPTSNFNEGDQPKHYRKQ